MKIRAQKHRKFNNSCRCQENFIQAEQKDERLAVENDNAVKQDFVDNKTKEKSFERKRLKRERQRGSEKVNKKRGERVPGWALGIPQE